MPRVPKAKNTLSAGERAALYEAEMAEKRAANKSDSTVSDNKNTDDEKSSVRITKKEEITKPKLPKPQHATVKVDFSIPDGQIKPMHSMCNGPVSYGADLSPLFKEIGVPFVRFDGTDGAISAFAIDISRIFKDIHADPNDSASYDFSYTDKYVAAAYNSGARVIFRLGESRDPLHSGKQVAAPDDIDLFVDISVNVVKHYNDYWANGYAYGIEYFEIWGMGDKPHGKDTERIFELYRRTSTALKLVDSDMKVGGMCFSSADHNFREFIKYCKKTRAPLDFVTLTSFDSTPQDAVSRIEDAVKLIRNVGFADTEVIIGAWNYIDKDAIGDMTLERSLLHNDERALSARKKLFEEQVSIKGSAYDIAFMIALGSLKGVSMACFYDAQPYISTWCSISDRFGNPEKPFYAFKAYGELYRAGTQLWSLSEQSDGYAHSGIYSLVAKNEAGLFVLISSFDGCGIVDLRLNEIPNNIYTADIYMLDGVKNMSLADSIQISGSKKRLLLNISQFGAALIKLY